MRLPTTNRQWIIAGPAAGKPEPARYEARFAEAERCRASYAME